MIDFNLIKNNTEKVAKALGKRGVEVDFNKILKLAFSHLMIFNIINQLFS